MVEFYELDGVNIYYFDLYCLVDLEELEFMGICDYFDLGVVVFIEWLEKGGEYLVFLDLVISINIMLLGR